MEPMEGLLAHSACREANRQREPYAYPRSSMEVVMKDEAMENALCYLSLQAFTQLTIARQDVHAIEVSRASTMPPPDTAQDGAPPVSGYAATVPCTVRMEAA
jgi:hypothetical protein